MVCSPMTSNKALKHYTRGLQELRKRTRKEKDKTKRQQKHKTRYIRLEHLCQDIDLRLLHFLLRVSTFIFSFFYVCSCYFSRCFWVSFCYCILLFRVQNTNNHLLQYTFHHKRKKKQEIRSKLRRNVAAIFMRMTQTSNIRHEF